MKVVFNIPFISIRVQLEVFHKNYLGVPSDKAQFYYDNNLEFPFKRVTQLGLFKKTNGKTTWLFFVGYNHGSTFVRGPHHIPEGLGTYISTEQVSK